MESVTASISPVGEEFGLPKNGGGEKGGKMVVWWDEKENMEKGPATTMTSRRVSVGPMPVFGPAPYPTPAVLQAQLLDPFADPESSVAVGEKVVLLDNPFDDLLAVDQPKEDGRRASSESRVSAVSTSSGRHVVVSSVPPPFLHIGLC